MIVSGQRKGTGSSRETAAQCERWAGINIVIAASFAPIHERNNINLGQLMGDHEMLLRLQQGEVIKLEEFTRKYDPVTKLIIEKEHSSISFRSLTMELQCLHFTEFETVETKGNLSINSKTFCIRSRS